MTQVQAKKISLLNSNAPKLKGTGSITYSLWSDTDSNFYVQMNENNGGTGTLSDLLFAISEYVPQCYSDESIGFPTGYQISNNLIDKNNRKDSENKDDGGFLKAVLRHLLP
jgi:hypothetical protein